MKAALLEALPFLPRHRARSKRASQLSLDDILDDRRASGELAGGVLDLVLMAYRYRAPFELAWREFSGKSLRPAELEDLLQILFGALLSRDRTPGPVLVSEAVEATRQAFGPAACGLVNAFGRKTLATKDAWLAKLEADPLLALPAALRERWSAHPAILARSARQLLRRPEAGIWSFDAGGSFAKREATAFREEGRLQAIDPGSWDLLGWILERVRANPPPAGAWLDACAAPGGKLLGLLARGTVPADAELHATDAKFRRVERLRENLARWGSETRVRTSLHAWGDAKADRSDELPARFAFALADLPCSGSGTLHTRPDLLDLDWAERMISTLDLQKRILAEVRDRVAPGGALFVSLCSVDPVEVDHVSGLLGRAPDFSSWDRREETCEGLTAWHVTNSR